MPLDLRGFTEQPNQWAGIYHAADQLEKRKLRQDQLDLQKQSRRAAAGTFLQNYLDPKDLMTGTAYDPMIVQGLQAAQQQGAQLAAAGADAPTLMMALGPMVNKLTQYSTNAKTINKQVDDQIKLMRESGLTGYDYGKLKDLAMKSAFYKQGANGQEMIDPGEVDANTNYLQKVIQENPEQVTTAAGLDLFAKNSPMQKQLYDQANYDRYGNMSKAKVHLIGQNWLQPEYSTEKGKQDSITGLVPKHDVATENGNPLFHEYTNELGKTTREPVRLLSENVYDDMMQRRPDIADYMRGVVKQHLNEYKDQTGKEISINDPRSKMIARAIAYNELNNRKTPSIENAEVNNKPSSVVANLNVQSTDKYLQNVYDKAAAAKGGRASVLSPEEEAKLYKRNVGEVLGDVFKGKENLSSSQYLNGKVSLSDGTKKEFKNRSVVDILSSMPGGSLKAGSGVDYDYKGIYFDPKSRSIIVGKETTTPGGSKVTNYDEIPEANIGQFINKVAEANGIPKAGVPALLEKIGYKDGKFQQNSSTSSATVPAGAAKDWEKIKKQKPWREATHKAVKDILSPTQKS